MTKKNESVWKNRIIGSGTADPRKLVPNPENWKIHPEQQQSTMKDALKEIGWVQQVVVNKTTGRIVDGHMRVTLAIEQDEKEVPVLYVNLSEDEEKKALLTLDPVGAMAGSNVGSYEDLAASVTTDSLWIRELMKYGAGNEVEEEKEDEEAPEEKEIPQMELQPFEHYDYIVLLFRDSQDFSRVCELLDIQRSAFKVPNSTKQKIGLGRVVDGAKAIAKLCKS